MPRSPVRPLASISGLVAVLLSLALGACHSFSAPPPSAGHSELTAEQVEAAYIWGLPIVTMYRYTGTMGTGLDAINQLFHFEKLFEPGLISGGPNRDTLYGVGWFDLADEPYVISLPDFGNRYFVWQLTDFYAYNFHNVGSHLLGQSTDRYRKGYRFLLAAPDWNGEVPEGLDLVRSPVRMVHVLYRIAVKDEPAEIAEGNRLMGETVTTPLSAWREGHRETVRVRPSVPTPLYREVLAFGHGVSGEDQRNPDFFSVLEDAISINRPYAVGDNAMVMGTLRALGFGSDDGFDFSGFEVETQEMILDAQAAAFEKVLQLKARGWGPLINGWQYGPSNHGDYGDDFLRRAYGTYSGGMWPKIENSTYALAFIGPQHASLVGVHRYRLRFEADQIPPATSFWSVTAYEAGTFDLYPNPEGLYVVGSNHPDTRFHDDGALEILFSHERPEALGENQNWIPVPEGEFFLAIRFYAPTPEVLSLEYEIPPVIRLD